MSMRIVDDLDAMTLSTTLVAVLLCALIAIMEIRDWKKPSLAKGGFWIVLLLAGTLWCGILGFSTLDDASDAKHSSVTGKLQVIGFAYAGRGSHVARYLACVEGCTSTSVPLIMEPVAQSIVREHGSSPTLKVGYLIETGKIRADANGFKVVDISDPSTGASLYHLDTSHHALRAGILFADAALFLLVGLLGLHSVNQSRSSY